MKEPYTSKVCKHSYSDRIIAHLREQHGQAECPVIGCNSYLRLSDLFKDKKLARKIARDIATQEEQAMQEEENAAVVSDEEEDE